MRITQEEKIISILKEHEAGASAKELLRRHGVAENKVHRWKAKRPDWLTANRLPPAQMFGLWPLTEGLYPDNRTDFTSALWREAENVCSQPRISEIDPKR